MELASSQSFNKKTNLFMLLEENDNNNEQPDDYKPRFSQIPSSQVSNENESTYLNSSTVPTYEEFTKKTTNQIINPAFGFNEFNNKFKKSYRRSTNRFLNSTEAILEGLVTDDESQEDSDSNNENEENYEKQKINYQNCQSPKLVKQENNENFKIYIKSSTSSASESEMTSSMKKSQQTPLQQINYNTPNKLISKVKAISDNHTPLQNLKKTPAFITPKQHHQIIAATPNSACSTKSNEYLVYDCKDTQTSFVSSQEQSNNNNLNNQYNNVDDDLIVINDSIEIEENINNNNNNNNTCSNTKNINSNLIDEITEMTSNFKLKLSSSSSSVASIVKEDDHSKNSKKDDDDIFTFNDKISHLNILNNVTIRKNRKKSSIFNKSKNNASLNSSASKTSNRTSKTKRVSICGEAFSENVFKIDDTIIDEYENELDHKSGKLITLDDTKDFNMDNSKVNDTKKSSVKEKKIESEGSSSADDRFEEFLSQYNKKKELERERELDKEPKKKYKNDLKDFIVEEDEDDDLEQIDEESEQEEDELPIKKPCNLLKSKDKEFVKLSSDEEDLFDDEKSDDSDWYGKDLQLFYIKTTNKINDVNNLNHKNKKNQKDKESNPSRSSLLDGSKSFISLYSSSSSSDSESSESNSPLSINSSTNSNSSLSSVDGHSSDIFRKKFRPFNKNLNNVKTISSDSNKFKTPIKQNTKSFEKEARLIKTQQVKKKQQETLSFIESLSNQLENEDERDPKATHFIKKFRFKKVKEELLKECYDQINKYAFKNQLPSDMVLQWNSRLSSTGGFCKNITKLGERRSEIHISTKVCDSPERLRDTLAHEMCHAAAFLINGLLDGHGKVWRSWANQVNITFKKIPRITIKHSYEVKKKYIYRCQKCHLEIHRFSKSIDTEKEICGVCYGKFDLLLNDEKYNDIKQTKLNQKFDRLAGEHIDIKAEDNQSDNEDTQSTQKTKGKQFKTVEATPAKQINKFAQYVKDNYNSVKKEKNLPTHKEVMQELSKNFKSLSTK